MTKSVDIVGMGGSLRAPPISRAGEDKPVIPDLLEA
jgi:hypothetical protein